MRALIAAITGFVLASVLPALASAQTVIRDTEIEQMLRDYTNPLLVAANLQPGDVDLYLIADPEINAFVTGGQNIFMHTGTILESESPNMLKGVIAHEIGHITGAHLARMGDSQRSAMVPAYVSIGLGVLAALAGEGGAAGALIASSQQFAMLSFLSYNRTQESAADQAGLQFLEATGQSGEGLVEFFERFAYQEAFSPAGRFPYFRSHPLSGERVAALRRRVEASPYYEAVDPPEEFERLRRMQGKIYGFLARPQAVFLRYPETDTSVEARYARSVAYYQNAQLAQARGELETLIAEEPDNPFFHELYGQMLFESGHADEAVPYHQQSVDLLPTAPLLRINLAMAMIATEEDQYLNVARDHLQVALDIEPDNGFAWYQLSIVHERKGETALAQLAVAEQAYASGNRPRAFQFAQRAQPQLQAGTPSWYRASELIAVSQPTEAEMREMRRQRRQQDR